MRRTPLFIAAVVGILFSLSAAKAQGITLKCDGETWDGQTSYTSLIFLDETTLLPERVIAWQRGADAQTWQIVGDFDTFDDETPTYPSDTVYRYVFRAADAEPGDPSVMITTGGFTGGSTAAVVSFGDDVEAEAMAILPCVGPAR